MVLFDQEVKARNDLRTVLSELSAFDPNELARKDLGADLNFETGVSFFARTLRLFHVLAQSDLEEIPFQKLQEINSVAVSSRDLFRNIQTFSVAKYQNNPINQRDSFINAARDQYDNIFNYVAPIVAFTVRKGVDFQRLEDEARQTIERMNTTALEFDNRLRATVKEAEQALEAVRRVAQEAGVSQHAIHFKGEADSQSRNAKPWLVSTIVLASATVLSGVLMVVRYFFVLPTLTPSQSVQLAIPKVFIFSVLLSATIWAGKTYRAYRHNAIVNRHREHALLTFQAFVKGTGDEATKNAVLLQATQCIFSPQQTGFIESTSEMTHPQVLEIFRNFGKTGG